jgi:hypothetical protein
MSRMNSSATSVQHRGIRAGHVTGAASVVKHGPHGLMCEKTLKNDMMQDVVWQRARALFTLGLALQRADLPYQLTLRAHLPTSQLI